MNEYRRNEIDKGLREYWKELSRLYDLKREINLQEMAAFQLLREVMYADDPAALYPHLQPNKDMDAHAKGSSRPAVERIVNGVSLE